MPHNYCLRATLLSVKLSYSADSNRQATSPRRSDSISTWRHPNIDEKRNLEQTIFSKHKESAVTQMVIALHCAIRNIPANHFAQSWKQPAQHRTTFRTVLRLHLHQIKMPEMKKAINKISGASRYEEMKSRSDDFVKKVRRQEKKDGKVRHITSEDSTDMIEKLKSILFLNNH